MRQPDRGPARSVGWGIVGTGAIAHAFAGGLAYVEGATLAAVGSRSQGSANAFASGHGGARAYASHEEMVGDPAVDVVYVATPNEVHAQHTLLAIAAGKAVLCEKPFAVDAAQANIVVEAARRARVFCMEAMWMRCSPVVQEVIELVRSGAIGDPRVLNAQLGFPNDLDPGSRVFGPEGGGALLDLGVYPVSLAHAVFGRPDRVTSSAVLLESGVDEQVCAILDYDDGRQAVVAASLRSHLTNAASIHGTRGVLRIDEPLTFPHRYHRTRVPVRAAGASAPRSARSRLRHHPVGRLLAEQKHRLRTQSSTMRVRGNGYSAEAAEVMRCVTEGRTESPLMSLDETVAVLETMDAMRSCWVAVT